MKTPSEHQFAGFSKPEANFFRLPNEWTDITAHITSLAEMKLVEYVLKHTWGYSEFDVVKKITTDEFMYGRKKKSGERIDIGTGLSKPSVIAGLKSAVAHGLLEEEIDDADKARIKKYYKLKMKTPIEEDESEKEAPHADVKKLYTGVKNFNIGGKQSLHRSEKDTKERYINVTKKNKKDTNETEYFAGLIAEKLGDQKSLTYYKIACQRSDPHMLLQKASEIMADGGARNPGAVFADWVKTRTMQPAQASNP
jgi:DNA-binding PadR family transcriptional regulator